MGGVSVYGGVCRRSCKYRRRKHAGGGGSCVLILYHRVLYNSTGVIVFVFVLCCRNDLPSTVAHGVRGKGVLGRGVF